MVTWAKFEKSVKLGGVQGFGPVYYISIWGYSITAITMVLQIINWSSILHSSTIANMHGQYVKIVV